MHVGFFQFMPEFGSVEKNLEIIEQAVTGKAADLLVLPELCTTGYQFVSRSEAIQLAEEIPDGPTIRRLTGLAKKTGMYLAAGLAEKDGSNIYNSAVLVGPGGLVTLYRKIHLFYEETLWFSPGDELPEIVEINGGKVSIIICFDWLFPEIFRILALRGTDIIVHPANLVLPYCQSAMQTRSIENRIFTVTANRTGTEKRGEKEALSFTGKSQITGVRGEILVRADENSEELKIVEIDPAEARDKRITRYNTIPGSRRPELYEGLFHTYTNSGD